MIKLSITNHKQLPTLKRDEGANNRIWNIQNLMY